MPSTTMTKFAHLQIPLEDVVKATNNFHDDNIIGRGGFGTAYKGQLQRSGKLIKIAALRLDRKSGEGNIEFWTEISVLSDLKHTNIVSIIGFCDEKEEKIIITTYTAKGSLKEHLKDPDLTWTQRLKICVGVARALSYLHSDEGRGYGVIHLNINSSTILLDENWEPKLSGFKVSIKQVLNRMDRVFLSEPIGTIGYMDPEIEKTKGVTHKSDVYSFGVVLFEILCGRRAYIKDEANRFLARLAKYHYQNETLQDIIHPDLRNQMSSGSLKIYSKMAYSCLEEERAHRPHMLNILNELERALKFQARLENFGNNFKHLKIRLNDIKLATDIFSDTYETGYYCTWHIAELHHFEKEKRPSSVKGTNKSELPKRHKSVVIKRFLNRYGEEEELFYTELEILTGVKHHNIVSLIGFCVEGTEMMLVIEKLSNGCLRDYLGNVKDRLILSWEKRLKICIDVAKTLSYLHYEMEDKKVVIHGNIHNAKFGLDENWGAKIDDFECAIILPPNKKDEDVCIRRSFESKYHVDPVYAQTGKLKRESDVYSFGVVLFEIVCGRHAYDQIYLKESEKGLVHVARRNFYAGKLEDMIDPTLKEETSKKSSILNRGANKNSLHTFLKVANQCVAETQDQRPTMQVVVKELKKALFFQEEGVQPQDKSNIVNEPELASHEVPEERVQQPDKDQVVDELETSHEIHVKNLEHLKIPLAEIKMATNNFSDTHKIASWGDYTLYKADLIHFAKENPSFVEGAMAIKRYPFRHECYGEEEYFTEIKMFSSVKHPNIVTLLGFCVEGSEMIVATENVCNGYLGHYLGNANNMRVLTWEKRLKICIDVAHALKYIHYEMEDQKIVINRDICSHNIGLDENWGAKIVSFWWSVFLPPNQEDEALYLNKWIGRPFNSDPEYKMTGKLKRESDVYGFGVVLFEILCGRPADDPIYIKESDKGLAYVARRRFHAGTLGEMIDPVIKEEPGENNFVLNRGPDKDSLNTFIEIAYKCVAETQGQRPTMKVVVKELEKALFFQKNKGDNPKMSLKDIKVATQNFHNDNCIGDGGFGKVFKGKIQNDDGFKTIVTKRLDTRHGQGEQQFLTELQILLEYKHENIIGLIGYCDEQDEKIIVYEYAPRGSLDRYLNNASLTWVKRLNICVDVASALYFLHGGAGKQAKVIHRDIKTANILLYHDWKAKLADFGLSLISPLIQDKDYVIDHACGTHGYLDPLYRKSGFLTVESDIYSFGVVLFEILCGRSTFAIMKHEGCYLPDFIKNNFEEGMHDELVFEKIREQIVPKSLATFLEIAYQCLHHEREKRPTTRKVLMQLRKALEFQNMPSTMTKFARLQIPLEEVVTATNNFHVDNIIGQGRFGTIYKGRLLRFEKEMKIVARRFDCKHEEADLEFLTEISVHFDLKHTNLVSIVGYCDEDDERIIVTTYEANGSLGRYLNNPNLTWTQRLRISIGVARALSYLHYVEGRDYAIIHCNINSDTILLDENWEAKLSCFEISIEQLVYYKDQLRHCEHIVTMECMDPEIEKTGGATHMSDVYAFGVVLFEILCGRKTFIQNRANRFLAPLAKHHYEKGMMKDAIHPDLHWNQVSPQSLLIYSNIAYSCLNEDPAARPNMDYIANELEKALELQLRRENIEKKFKHLKMHLSDIKLATDDFSMTFTIPSFDNYSLYRAKLDHFEKETTSSIEEKKTVVIKRYPSEHDVYREEQFFTEIELLTSVKHPNIVTLVGFCVEGSEMILVVDNVSKGHLGSYLGNVNEMRVLTWEKRLKICIDVAHALKYIHSEMEDQKMIINRDICSQNIGLDENWRAKIVNFWFAIYLPPNQEEEALFLKKIVGRKYYIDPEYVKTSKVKRESDVYGFGVVLFEILCGRIAYDPIYLKESKEGLATVARRCFRMGTLEEMIDPIIKEEAGENSLVQNKGPNKDSLQTFIEIAYKCVAETQDQRPTMEVVVKELEKALFIQVNGSAN